MKDSLFSQKTEIRLGPITLNLPAFTFGQGPKTIGLVLGVHGVETSGLLLLKKMFDKRNKLKNKLKVIPSANPSGLILASRFGELDLPMDKKDPNRVFPGQNDGNIQQRVNFAVLELISDCDFVLDIHNFSNLGPSFPILTTEGLKGRKGEQTVLPETLNFLKIVQAEFAFFINTIQARKRGFSGTLDETLNRKGIPNLSFELPPLEFWLTEDAEVFAQKLINAINNVGSQCEVEEPLPRLINTRITRSEIAGIFIPSLKPPADIKKGQSLGEIFDPFNFESTKIESPSDGLLVIIKRKNFVRVGEFLFEIGYEIQPHL